ncbi:DUF262 domain-containing protein [Kriegella aquimaris]|uniref:DUF262 domain-containing protein n=1 Tax=Kriegella aquimaris TaxID=192904 RepID=A0A1G9SL18_9FLAO|nr:DUF262 domain-containing protein [Kriegella aquimaris]SDM35970.1 Protein of unknown function [Kriegella aquimaris]
MSQDQFTILAQTRTLLKTSNPDYGSILENDFNYKIPIYQRPYSWRELDIEKFIKTINKGFEDNDPVFIGTMQLTEQDNNDIVSVIDGQQRLTTFLMIFKAINWLFPHTLDSRQVNSKWLTTDVNNGLHAKYLNEVLESHSAENINDNGINPYAGRILFIYDKLKEILIDDESVVLVDDFVDYIFTKVYFVVIVTKAGLSKTIQIFNTINTTGLDLNGSDIFKIKMFEYLKKFKNAEDTIFNEISSLYERVDKSNEKRKIDYIGMTNILRIYQYIIITRHNLPKATFDLNPTTFFERLFDSLLNVTQWPNFKSANNNVDLSLDDLEKIIELRYSYFDRSYSSPEEMLAVHLLGWSRYRVFWDIKFLFVFYNRDKQDVWESMVEFDTLLAKLVTIYSVRYSRSINRVVNAIRDLMFDMVNTSEEEIIEKLKTLIGNREKHNGNGNDLNWFISNNLTENAKRKYIVCLLSAFLDELETKNYKTNEEIINLEKSLFKTDVDIEHIESYHHEDVTIRPEHKEEWKNHINTLGNLMVLERDYNRQIKNKSYLTKLKTYDKSQYATVQRVRTSNKGWDIEKCESRKREEEIKLFNFLFNHYK